MKITWLKKQSRKILRAIAFLLLCVSAFCVYWWLYKLAPSRLTLDPKWYTSHSQAEYWREVQKGILRGSWSHDDGFAVGLYGDKAWAEWIMAHVKPGTNMSCLGSPCHSAEAMQYITNQSVGHDSDEWLKWWDKNKSKSQLDWIKDGFRRYGVEVDKPPLTPEQTLKLLGLLGNSESDKLKAIAPEVKYNAFRFLRDSGFNPVEFALSEQAISAEIQRGLRKYEKNERLWPSVCGVGLLPFVKKESPSELIPVMLTPRFQFAANFLVYGLPLIAIAILICSFQKKPAQTNSPKE